MLHRGRKNQFERLALPGDGGALLPERPRPVGKPAAPPRHLSSGMRAWWRAVTAEHELDAHRLHLLRLAREAFDRCQQARRQLRRQGLRDSRKAFVRLVQALGLDPPGGAAARTEAMVGGARMNIPAETVALFRRALALGRDHPSYLDVKRRLNRATGRAEPWLYSVLRT
jgi:hypothetical protein